PELLGIAQDVLLRLVLEDEEAGREPAILATQCLNFAGNVSEDVGVGHIPSLERGNNVASALVIRPQLLPGKTGFAEEGEMRALRAVVLEPQPDIAEFGPAAIETAPIFVEIADRDIG